MNKDRTIRCRRCDDQRWVCENHPDKPALGATACTCGGAGEPCPDCDPSDAVTNRTCRRTSLSIAKRIENGPDLMGLEGHRSRPERGCLGPPRL